MEELEVALAALRQDLVVGIPTDTVYGIGADPSSPRATAALFDLKERDLSKQVGLLVADLAQALEMVELPAYALAWADLHWPGPLNLIGRPQRKLEVGSSDSLAVRVPDHPAALGLLEAFGPLAVTSANVSGGPETHSDMEARAVFGARVAAYIPGICPGGVASTTIDVREETPIVVRQGPIRHLLPGS